MSPPALMFVIALLWASAADANAAATTTAASDTWQRPVDGSILRTFVLAPNHFAPGQHRGVDLAAPRGSPVRATCSGRVTFAGTVPAGGRTVSVRCGRLIATYQQLGILRVRRGASVVRGVRLGAVGRSKDPRTARPHLHLGARVAATGRYVDPLSLFGESPRTVPLLPPARPLQRRPVPLGPALPLPQAQPARVPAVRAVAAPARPPPVSSTPWTVWAGLACVGVGLGLPLGGLVTARRRARRRQALAPRVAAARR